jgi:ribosomal protein S18 acetylase RimI-like enzyme
VNGRPELIIIFADPSYQNRGLGTRLIELCEEALREQKINSYTVKTEDDPTNQALRFYVSKGFHTLRRIEHHGLSFQVFEKNLRSIDYCNQRID